MWHEIRLVWPNKPLRSQGSPAVLVWSECALLSVRAFHFLYSWHPVLEWRERMEDSSNKSEDGDKRHAQTEWKDVRRRKWNNAKAAPHIWFREINKNRMTVSTCLSDTIILSGFCILQLHCFDITCSKEKWHYLVCFYATDECVHIIIVWLWRETALIKEMFCILQIIIG